ncbi:PorV/PorQ family protein [Salinibacter ruber]|uniref:PorV/PorQ family protein n=1 Tax=Salinibacter ruber TaxID=146919 RepID=UPI00207413F7|nr:PorV/PorQ family protein [Salinibacter ruber]
MPLRRLGRSVLGLFLLAALGAGPAHGQRLAKYGAEFLAGGVDARALGMGGAYVGLADEVSAGYWNPAGLHGLSYPEIGYMHVERFAGAVSFDYGGVAMPVTARSTVGVSVFRSGVNDIVNTLAAWNPDRGQPLPDYESRITRFSAADWALFVSYSRAVSDRLSVGVNFKGIHRSIGDFANAWGYSMDVAARYQAGPYRLGVVVRDVTTMLQSWSVNPSAFEVNCINPIDEQPFDACLGEDGTLIENNAARYQAVFDQRIPQGGTALVLPVARLGSGAVWAVGDGHRLTVGLDVDVAVDGRRAFVPNIGDVSFRPRLGLAFRYAGVVELRGGVQRLQVGTPIGVDLTPSVGAGLDLEQVSVDFSFGDFAGIVADDLGYSYRISAQLRLEQPGLERPAE